MSATDLPFGGIASAANFRFPPLLSNAAFADACVATVQKESGVSIGRGVLLEPLRATEGPIERWP